MILGTMTRTDTKQQVVLRGDSTTACLAANSGVVYSPDIRITLSIFVNACQARNIQYWVLHLGKRYNRIGDIESRMEPSKSKEVIHAAGRKRNWQDIWQVMHNWEAQFLKAAKLFRSFDPQTEQMKESTKQFGRWKI